MSCYSFLAPWYDELTGDVPYEDFADYYEAEFHRKGGEFRLVLDLCCGTGTLTWAMARRGYEMIGVDQSSDMLTQAQSKAAAAPVPPLFLCQEASKLDLYGTVDAAVCSLDGMNYIPPEKLPQVFHRLSLFVRPGGLLIFDLRTPEFLRALDGGVFVDETDDMLCLWRADYDNELDALIYGMDIFSKAQVNWSRRSEEHREYAHSAERLAAMLQSEGFASAAIRSDGPQGDDGRIFIIAER